MAETSKPGGGEECDGNDYVLDLGAGDDPLDPGETELRFGMTRVSYSPGSAIGKSTRMARDKIAATLKEVPEENIAYETDANAFVIVRSDLWAQDDGDSRNKIDAWFAELENRRVIASEYTVDHEYDPSQKA